MTFFKIIYHFRAFVYGIVLKMIYGKHIKIGKKTTWRKGFSVLIDKNSEIIIGDGCFFNNYCSIASMNRVTIGNDCLFGENVKIYDHNHRFADNTKRLKEQGFSIGSICIGDNCWIGSNVTILKGAVIGNNCVIGAGCVVNGLIEDGSILKNNNNYITQKIITKCEDKS